MRLELEIQLILSQTIAYSSTYFSELINDSSYFYHSTDDS